ncbi:MAG: hypothetical protein JWQ49_5788 [Edaphobacter sp.]|nr:hypothetical protein [Edaphobacter sp.]
MIPYIGPEMINALLRREITSSCPPASSPHSPHSPHSDIKDESDSVPQVRREKAFFLRQTFND